MAKHMNGVSEAAARAQLERIIGSNSFSASDRNRRFLAYVVEEALCGRPERIKAYAIATQVFGRGENFDPQTDSIVRIEAGRLRRALERYYLTAGREDPVRIGLPRGTYAPEFCDAGSDPANADPGFRAAVGRKKILVGRFDEEGDHIALANFGRGFVRALVVALSRFSHLQVYGAGGVLGGPDHAPFDDRGMFRDVDYTLGGGLVLVPPDLQIDVVLMEAATDCAVWAGSFAESRDLGKLLVVRNQIANQIAQSIAQSSGLIYSDTGHTLAHGPATGP